MSMKKSESLSRHRYSKADHPHGSSPKAKAGQMAFGHYSSEFMTHTKLGKHPQTPSKGKC